ncbi:ComF family protein [Candidatus Dojkabacteria bacterium]|uniref:ComF family protein n=1 Tax=Candidatus Dojkabacteria bacterium TaxID=2099670 RepID=A0A955L2N7_9BACT|nr:ComF family protein [Candidatus Dojkabacteria bacterium]
MLENNSLRELSHSNTIITCVPIHISRKRWRGFNQSELLAKEIAKQKNLEFLQLLKKGTNTLPQVGLNKKQREANLKNTFEFNYTKVTKTNQIVLVDDIITTGTTLIECTRTLRNAGFKGQISAVTFTRGT